MNDYMSGIAKEVGLEYNFDKAIIHNTLNAHRLLHLAKKHGVQNELKERLFEAYYTKGEDTGNVQTLVEIGRSVGLDESEIGEVFSTDAYTSEVKLDQQLAEQVGAQGVPFYVFNNKYAVSGAQPTEVFSRVLDKVWEEEKPVLETVATSGVCTPDGNCN